MADNEKWRRLCESILAEKDPAKVWQLAEELSSTLRESELDAGTGRRSGQHGALPDESI
jgi:hypothetical protein